MAAAEVVNCMGDLDSSESTGPSGFSGVGSLSPTSDMEKQIRRNPNYQQFEEEGEIALDGVSALSELFFCLVSPSLLTVSRSP